MEYCEGTPNFWEEVISKLKPKGKPNKIQGAVFQAMGTVCSKT